MADRDRWREENYRDDRYGEDRRRLDEVRRAYGAEPGSDRYRSRSARDEHDDDSRRTPAESFPSRQPDRDETRDVRHRQGFWGRGQEDRGFASEQGRSYSREDYGSTGRSSEFSGGGGREFGRAEEFGRDTFGYGRERSQFGPDVATYRYADSPRRDLHYAGDQARSYGQRAERSSGDYSGDRGFFERATDEVSSWFGDRDAERRREQDHRGRGPKGYRRSDSRIQDDVSDRLAEDPYVDASEIDVSVSNAEVTLGGIVDSRNARRRAEDLTEQVSGVSYVQNNLRVRHLQSEGAQGGRTTVATTGGEAGVGRTEAAGRSTRDTSLAGMAGGASQTDKNGPTSGERSN